MAHYDNKFKKCMLERFLVPKEHHSEQLDELYYRVYLWLQKEYPSDDIPSEKDIKIVYEEFMNLFIQKKYMINSALMLVSKLRRDDYKYFINELKRYLIQEDYSTKTPCDINLVTFERNYIGFFKISQNPMYLLLLQILKVSYSIRVGLERSIRLAEEQRLKKKVPFTGAIFDNKLETGESRIAFTDYYKNNKSKSVVWKKLLSCIPPNFIDPVHDHESVVIAFFGEMIDMLKSDVSEDDAKGIIATYEDFFDLVHLQDNMVKFMRLINGKAKDFYQFFKILRKVAYIHNVHPTNCNFNMSSVFDAYLKNWKDDLPRKDKIKILFITVLFHSWDRKQRLNMEELTDAESAEEEVSSIMPPTGYQLATFKELEEDARKATPEFETSTFDQLIEDINEGNIYNEELEEYLRQRSLAEPYTPYPYPAIEDSKKRKRSCSKD